MEWNKGKKWWEMQEHIGAIVQLDSCYGDRQIQVVVEKHAPGVLLVALNYPDEVKGPQGGENPNPIWIDSNAYLAENPGLRENYQRIRQKYGF
jgi:hypothetical protein